MARRKINIVSALSEIDHKIEVTERKLLSAKSKVLTLETRKADLLVQRQTVKLSVGAIFGPHTGKNQNLYLAWAAIERRFVESEGDLPSSALFEAAKDELLRLHPVTFRSYLSRFRDEGLVAKYGSRWRCVVRRVGPITPFSGVD